MLVCPAATVIDTVGLVFAIALLIIAAGKQVDGWIHGLLDPVRGGALAEGVKMPFVALLHGYREKEVRSVGGPAAQTVGEAALIVLEAIESDLVIVVERRDGLGVLRALVGDMKISAWNQILIENAAAHRE